jgi:hypothetical protein
VRKSKQLQQQLTNLLADIFGGDCVSSERSMRHGAADALGDSAKYAPVPDIAVGPFNLTNESVVDDVDRIKSASQHWLIDKIEQICKCQNGDLSRNANPRCLLAIEIAFSGAPKYILGEFANASMMGLVGVVIGSSDTFHKLRRIGKYVEFLRLVGKAGPGMFTNVACLRAEDFIALLEAARQHRDADH